MPVIAVSASASTADQQNSLAVGASAFLPKPIAMPQLLAQIGTLLKLEWVTPASDLADTAPGGGTLLAPPPEELDLLYHLAQVGNMNSIRAQAERLAALGAAYEPLAERLRHLAGHFQSRAILELVKKFRTPAASE